METTEASGRGRAREIAVPAAGLTGLRKHLEKEAGPLAAIHALQAAGYGAGEALWESLRAGPGTGLPDLDLEDFWTRLASQLGRRGWGTLEHRAAHPGIGLLSSEDWAESVGGGEAEHPSCSFSAGMLSGLLSSVAEGPIAVLEVTCRTRGDQGCTFAYGSAATVHDLYGLMLDGRSLESALAGL